METESFEKTGQHPGKRDNRFQWEGTKLILPKIEERGTQEWGYEGIFHRDTGPAIILEDGYQAWYKNGKRHRDDGPAKLLPEGTSEWWIENTNPKVTKVRAGTET